MLELELFGRPYKHDLAVTVALGIQILTDSPVSIVTDDDYHYRHFGGDINEISIDRFPPKGKSIVYDNHVVLGNSPTRFFVCDHSKTSIDLIKGVLSPLTEAKGLVVVSEESTLGAKYLSTFLGREYMEYVRSSSRLYDMCYDNSTKFRNITPDFLKVVHKILTIALPQSTENVKQLSSLLKRRF